MYFFQRIKEELDKRKIQGNYRELPLISWRGDDIIFDSMDFTDLASNDYLCIARDTAILNSFFKTVLDNSSGCDFVHEVLSSSISLGSTGSRLLTGNHTTYAYCEELLASLYNGCVQCELANNDCCYHFPEDFDSLDPYHDLLPQVYSGYYDCNVLFQDKDPLNEQIKNDCNHRYIENIVDEFSFVSHKKHKQKNSKLHAKNKVKVLVKDKKIKKEKTIQSDYALDNISLKGSFGDLDQVQLLNSLSDTQQNHADFIENLNSQNLQPNFADLLSQDQLQALNFNQSLSNNLFEHKDSFDKSQDLLEQDKLIASDQNRCPNGMQCIKDKLPENLNSLVDHLSDHKLNDNELSGHEDNECSECKECTKALNQNKASLAEFSAMNALNNLDHAQAIEKLSTINQPSTGEKNHTDLDYLNQEQSKQTKPHKKESIFNDLGVKHKGSYEEKDCLYINSGFDANAGIIATLFSERDLLLVDKLCHASIIDGMTRAKAKAIRFAHNDLKHLNTLIEKYYNDFDSIVIITESVFSMDGDRAKLKEIVALKEQYDKLLIYVDEAHSFGLLGESGLGLCQELKIIHKVDFIMGTLSKAIGSQGAFFICNKEVKAYLVNFMRAFIFSTALPPVNVTFSMYIIGLLKTTALQYKREYLSKLSNYLHLNLKEMELWPSESQIQPLVTGDNDKALQASQIFREAGLLALPIRHPTVPVNKARLRLSLNCNLTIDDIDLVCKLIKRNRKLFVS